jgi:hypothetical protein
VTENIKISKKLFIVGSNVTTSLESVYDSRGRKVASQAKTNSFQLRMTTTPDDSHPGYQEYQSTREAINEIIFPHINPVTNQPFNYQPLPPVGIKMEVIDNPYIHPFAFVTEFNGTIPQASEVSAALTDPDRYKRLLASSPLRVHLLCEGWGPFNWHM